MLTVHVLSLAMEAPNRASWTIARARGLRELIADDKPVTQAARILKIWRSTTTRRYYDFLDSSSRDNQACLAWEAKTG